MKYGAVFPQTEIGADPGAIKTWAQTVEHMGFDHIVVYDHVIGANRASRPDWQGFYDCESMYHEPMTIMSFLAGVTTRIGFFTGILILPQRQTVLAAKQAACVDVLCNGRLRFGVGVGWNAVEYEALNVPFAQRGDILDDQVGVLRALWTTPAVTLKTPYHTITDAGLNPLPIQRPIPIWFGGGGRTPLGQKPPVEKVLQRIARLGDGWMPPFAPDDEGAETLALFRDAARAHGRDPAHIGIEPYVMFHRATEATWTDTTNAWRKLGATHFAVHTLQDGLRGCDQHLRRLEEVAKAISIPRA
jgi:probable F420-dependent oxidoreductase